MLCIILLLLTQLYYHKLCKTTFHFYTLLVVQIKNITRLCNICYAYLPIPYRSPIYFVALTSHPSDNHSLSAPHLKHTDCNQQSILWLLPHRTQGGSTSPTKNDFPLLVAAKPVTIIILSTKNTFHLLWSVSY